MHFVIIDEIALEEKQLEDIFGDLNDIKFTKSVT